MPVEIIETGHERAWHGEETAKLALIVRHLVENTCADILTRLGRAYGPHLLAFDLDISRRYAEVELYIRQSHAAPTRILLVDDHTLFRESLVRLFESEPDICVVADCATVSAAIDALRHTPVDVVLLDYDLGEERGTDLLRELRACNSLAKVLMVTAEMSDRITLDVLNAGVTGVLYKHSKPDQLLEAIRKIAHGEMWLDSDAIQPVTRLNSG